MNSSSRPSPARARGNTLIGIIIGLVIGLGIAVVVALTITKGATPFTDRASKAGRQTDGAGLNTDPNKPMYGNKDAAREAARVQREAAKPAQPAPGGVAGATPASPASPANPASPVTPPVPAAQPTQPTPRAPEPDALEQALSTMKMPADVPTPAPERPVAPAAPARADAGEDKFIYYLQVGAFRAEVDAESARAKLALLGFEAAISERATDNGVLHRVRTGPYTQVEAMNRARSKLSENGVDVAVVRNQK